MGEPSPVLVANAPLVWSTHLASVAAMSDPLLAADGGANHLARLGLRPHAVIGDLDSLDPTTRAWLGEERLVERPDQERTDLEKALEYAFSELGLPRLRVLAAIGGRADHSLANLGLLARWHRGRDLVYECTEEVLLAAEGQIDLPSEPGETWSFWSFDPGVRVSLDGVRWPVDDLPLDAGGRPSISNEAIGDLVRVRTAGGPVVVMRAFGLRSNSLHGLKIEGC